MLYYKLEAVNCKTLLDTRIVILHADLLQSAGLVESQQTSSEKNCNKDSWMHDGQQALVRLNIVRSTHLCGMDYLCRQMQHFADAEGHLLILKPSLLGDFELEKESPEDQMVRLQQAKSMLLQVQELFSQVRAACPAIANLAGSEPMLVVC